MLDAESVLASRWTPAALAITHLMLVGFISSIMCGALLQLLAVLIGAPARLSSRTARILAPALALGVLLLSFGLYRLQNLALLTGALLTGAVLLLLLFKVLHALMHPALTSPLRFPLRIALIALTMTLLLGLTLVAERQAWLDLALGKAWTNLHMSWGLAGWMGLLLLTLGSELMALFYLTPARPRWLTLLLIALACGLLVLFSLSLLVDPQGPITYGFALALAGLFGFSMIDSFIAQFRRKRARIDASLGFWWLGQASLLLALGLSTTQTSPYLLGVLLIFGAASSFTTGALLKIVPFLCWYHLQAEKVRLRRIDYRLPTMQDFIPARDARVQLLLHSTALAFLLSGIFIEHSAAVGGLLLAGSALWLWAQLIRASLRTAAIQQALQSA